MLYCVSSWVRGYGTVHIVPAESEEDAIKKLADAVNSPVFYFHVTKRVDNLTEITLVYEQDCGEEE